MIKYRYLFLFVISLQSFFSHGQSNFFSGYYIHNSGDTIKGYIEVRTKKRNAKLITFKDDLGSKETILYPNMVTEVGILEKVKYQVYSLEKESVNENFFFELIASGKLDLLQLGSERFFARYNYEGKVKLIEISGEHKEKKGMTTKKSIYRNKGILRALMASQEELLPIIDKAKNINPKFLKKLFISYNNINHSNLWIGGKIKQPLSVKYGINTGLNLTKVQFQNSMFQNAEFVDNQSPTFGVDIETFVPRINPAVRFVFSSAYMCNDFYSFFREGNSNNDAYVEYDIIDNSVVLRYYIERGSGFFFQSGLKQGILFSDNIKWRQERILSDNIITTRDIIGYSPLSKSYVGYSFGIGKNINLGSQLLTFSFNYSSITSGVKKEVKSKINSVDLKVSYWIK